MPDPKLYGGISMVEYLAILLPDAGYQTSAQRRGWLQLRFGKQYADELNPQKQHRAIELLREEKSNTNA